MGRMRNARRIALLLGGFLAAVIACASPAVAQTGSIEFVARVRPSSGLAEPARGLPFVLLRKSFADIRKEADNSEPKPDLDAFIDKLELSKELKAWMKKNRTVKLSGVDFAHTLKPKDIMNIPEFYSAYLERNVGDRSINFPQPKFRERDITHDPQKYEKQKQEYRDAVEKFLLTNPQSADGMEIELMSLDPNQKWERLEGERVPAIRRRALDWSETRYLAGHAETDLGGRGVFRGIAPGNYWLSTLEVEAVAGDARLRWDTPVTVLTGQTTRIELSNFNAVEPPRGPR
jgi:hypothetical protein